MRLLGALSRINPSPSGGYRWHLVVHTEKRTVQVSGSSHTAAQAMAAIREAGVRVLSREDGEDVKPGLEAIR